MTKPVLQRLLINLKANGKSKFWISATNVIEGNTVAVFANDGSNRSWIGSAEKVIGNAVRVGVSRVHFEADADIPYVDSEKKIFGAGDVIDVDITITNGTLSDPLSGFIAVDDGPEN